MADACSAHCLSARQYQRKGDKSHTANGGTGQIFYRFLASSSDTCRNKQHADNTLAHTHHIVMQTETRTKTEMVSSLVFPFVLTPMTCLTTAV